MEPDASESSTIKDGLVSGLIPESESFAIHYPGYPSSTSRAVQTLGGLSQIAKARSSGSGLMELKFRPEDPFCHPVIGELKPTTGLLLKLNKKQDGELSTQVVTRVNQAYHFEGMADYQHVVPVHAAKSRPNKTPDENSEDFDGPDVMMLVPPLFSIKNTPETIILKPPPNVFSKGMQRGVVVHQWEVPKKVKWEENIPKTTTEYVWQESVCKLFDEKPIWPKPSIQQKLVELGLEISNNQLKRLLFRAGYYFLTGPFGKFWIRRGYDPRKDPESRIYQRIDFRMPPELRNIIQRNPDAQSTEQKWKEICNFAVIPCKIFVLLQLSELQDDFIQEEIKKPSYQLTCSHATGWFSEPMLKCLRLQVLNRFLSLCPVGSIDDLKRSVKIQLERSNKEETVWRSQSRQKNDDPDLNTGKRALSESSGEEEEEEEEEEFDEYQSPPKEFGDNIEGIPNNYLQELLRTIPNLDQKGKNSVGMPDSGTHFDSSDEEYEILEQSSDENEEF
ncbi:hypothetical protein LUZ60_007126 [Juncus effusus]|nr:hypothetical protein LUZ60_007126 [Juncus effusus]